MIQEIYWLITDAAYYICKCMSVCLRFKEKSLALRVSQGHSVPNVSRIFLKIYFRRLYNAAIRLHRIGTIHLLLLNLREPKATYDDFIFPKHRSMRLLSLLNDLPKNIAQQSYNIHVPMVK